MCTAHHQRVLSTLQASFPAQQQERGGGWEGPGRGGWGGGGGPGGGRGQGEGEAKGVMRGARTRRMGGGARGRERPGGGRGQGGDERGQDEKDGKGQERTREAKSGRGKGEDDGETKEGKQEGGHMLKPKQHGNLATATEHTHCVQTTALTSVMTCLLRRSWSSYNGMLMVLTPEGEGDSVWECGSRCGHNVG